MELELIWTTWDYRVDLDKPLGISIDLDKSLGIRVNLSPKRDWHDCGSKWVNGTHDMEKGYQVYYTLVQGPQNIGAQLYLAHRYYIYCCCKGPVPTRIRDGRC